MGRNSGLRGRSHKRLKRIFLISIQNSNIRTRQTDELTRKGENAASLPVLQNDPRRPPGSSQSLAGDRGFSASQIHFLLLFCRDNSAASLICITDIWSQNEDGWMSGWELYVPGILCLLEATVCSGPEISFVFPYGPSSAGRAETPVR